MQYKHENQTLTIWLEGHIDSVNAAETERSIAEICTQNEPEALILDCEKLEYIRALKKSDLQE